MTVRVPDWVGKPGTNKHVAKNLRENANDLVKRRPKSKGAANLAAVMQAVADMYEKEQDDIQ